MSGHLIRHAPIEFRRNVSHAEPCHIHAQAARYLCQMMGSLVAGWSAGNKGQFGIAMHELLHHAPTHRQQLNPRLQPGRASTSVNVRNACVLQGYSDHGLRPLDSAIRFALRGRLGLSGKILIISHIDHASTEVASKKVTYGPICNEEAAATSCSNVPERRSQKLPAEATWCRGSAAQQLHAQTQ